jgi:CO/xanthine dehydrogenase Mo-binding subunit
MKLSTGVKRDGSITALHPDACSTGRYGSYGVASTYYTGALQTVTYQIPPIVSKGARLHQQAAVRSEARHGTPQPRFAQECSSTRSRCDLELDPRDLRKRTPAARLPDGELPARRLDRSRRLHRQGRGGFGMEGAPGRSRRPGSARLFLVSLRRGLPIYWNSMPQSGVQLKLDRSGGVTVFCGSTDIGQGSDSILASIVAEVLGIDPSTCRS